MSKRAFTLAELVIALGLLTILLIGSVTLFTRLLAANRKTSSTMVGVTFACLKLEEIVESNNFAAVTGSQGSYVMDPNLGTQFCFQIQSEPLQSVTGGTTPYLGGYLVTVDVWWNAATPTQAKPGVGLQRVQLRRFLYPRVNVP
ncbi:hypothetical protein IV102_06800 [bacterium]|nr:hypothetical protein [bacterium]